MLVGKIVYIYSYALTMIYFYKSRHNKHKRSFDVAFLAGTRGNTSDNDTLLNINCDDKNKSSITEDTLYKVNYKYHDNGILQESCAKSAFRKVNQQQPSPISTIKQTGTINGRNVGWSTHVDTETAAEDETNTGKTSNNRDNNNSPMDDKDNETNCLIDPRGDIQSIEHRVT